MAVIDGEEGTGVETTKETTSEGANPETSEAGENTEAGGDPITSEESSVVIEDEDGEIDEEEVIDEPRYCKGTFTRMKASEFTQNKNYSDYYLKTKGLFVEPEDEA